MKKLTILICVLTLMSCSQETEFGDLVGVNFDTAVDFSIVNAQGEDLLNPNHPNTIDIKIIAMVR